MSTRDNYLRLHSRTLDDPLLARASLASTGAANVAWLYALMVTKEHLYRGQIPRKALDGVLIVRAWGFAWEGSVEWAEKGVAALVKVGLLTADGEAHYRIRSWEKWQIDPRPRGNDGARAPASVPGTAGAVPGTPPDGPADDVPPDTGDVETLKPKSEILTAPLAVEAPPSNTLPAGKCEAVAVLVPPNLPAYPPAPPPIPAPVPAAGGSPLRRLGGKAGDFHRKSADELKAEWGIRPPVVPPVLWEAVAWVEAQLPVADMVDVGPYLAGLSQSYPHADLAAVGADLRATVDANLHAVPSRPATSGYDGVPRMIQAFCRRAEVDAKRAAKPSASRFGAAHEIGWRVTDDGRFIPPGHDVPRGAPTGKRLTPKEREAALAAHLARATG